MFNLNDIIKNSIKSSLKIGKKSAECTIEHIGNNKTNKIKEEEKIEEKSHESSDALCAVKCRLEAYKHIYKDNTDSTISDLKTWERMNPTRGMFHNSVFKKLKHDEVHIKETIINKSKFKREDHMNVFIKLLFKTYGDFLQILVAYLLNTKNEDYYKDYYKPTWLITFDEIASILGLWFGTSVLRENTGDTTYGIAFGIPNEKILTETPYNNYFEVGNIKDYIDNPDLGPDPDESTDNKKSEKNKNRRIVKVKRKWSEEEKAKRLEKKKEKQLKEEAEKKEKQLKEEAEKKAKNLARDERKNKRDQEKISPNIPTVSSELESPDILSKISEDEEFNVGSDVEHVKEYVEDENNEKNGGSKKKHQTKHKSLKTKKRKQKKHQTKHKPLKTKKHQKKKDQKKKDQKKKHQTKHKPFKTKKRQTKKLKRKYKKKQSKQK